jgi:hypothetical protein
LYWARRSFATSFPARLALKPHYRAAQYGPFAAKMKRKNDEFGVLSSRWRRPNALDVLAKIARNLGCLDEDLIPDDIAA